MADANSIGWGQVNKAVTSGTKKIVDTGRKVAEVAAAVTPVGRDAAALVKAARFGKDAVETLSRSEEAKLAAAKLEKPYAKSYKGTQGKDANLTTTRGSAKESPQNNTRINLQKVVEPASPKNIAAREKVSEQKIAAAKEDASESISVAKGNLARTGGGTLAAAGAYQAGRDSVSKSAPQPTSTSNPVRPAGDSTTKIHPDNKPALGNR